MKRTVATTLVLAAPLSALLWLSGAVPLHLAVGGVTLVTFCVALSGFLALRALRLADLPASAAWVAGVFATALVMYALVAWFKLLALHAFALWAAALAGAAIAFPERGAPPQRLDRKELAGLALCGLVTLMWCRELAQAPAALARDGQLHAWIDYFVHGGIISQFGDPLAVRGSVFLADQPPLLYHYATYMLPAALAGLLDQPGLPLATSYWLPMGVLTMCAGAYTLGATLAGVTGALASVAVLTLLPDASNYGLRNGFLSFHFHMVVSPGADFVVGLFLLCAALLLRWVPRGSPRPLVASALLAVGALWFRVQLFAVGFPAWLAAAGLAAPAVRARKLLFCSAALLAFLLFVIAFYAATDSALALPVFLEVVHDRQEPTAYPNVYLPMRDTPYAIPAGIALMYAASLGAWIVLYPLALWLAQRAGALRASGSFPGFVLAGYLAVMLTAPIDKYRDSTEFTVRPFVLVYAAVAVWTVCLLCRAFALRWPQRAPQAWRPMLGVCLLGVALAWHATPAMVLPKFDWGWEFYPRRVHAGLTQAGRYLREHGRPGQVFGVRGLELKWAATDPAVQLIALSGMPAYLSYISAHTIEAPSRGKLALQRYAELARIDRAPSAPAALEALRRLGIDWYVVTGWSGPPWDPQWRQARFFEGSVAIYAVPER
ncbi:MAG TPA: hypothetical protein VF004_03725 [Burkholderiales bacterium]